MGRSICDRPVTTAATLAAIWFLATRKTSLPFLFGAKVGSLTIGAIGAVSAVVAANHFLQGGLAVARGRQQGDRAASRAGWERVGQGVAAALFYMSGVGIGRVAAQAKGLATLQVVDDIPSVLSASSSLRDRDSKNVGQSDRLDPHPRRSRR